jgi:hypothetical protein
MHGAFVGVARDSFVVNTSKALTSYNSSPDTVRTFCGCCGSPITWDRKDYERIYVSLGLLDGKIAVPKIIHLHTRNKGAYYSIA